jgi:hypothetical protein
MIKVKKMDFDAQKTFALSREIIFIFVRRYDNDRIEGTDCG